ncbi:hypothetical protein KY284_037206 [Solanum tuberosum]|nr:hypothetical protein KY284_037206 [Solanum tuberosum]
MDIKVSPAIKELISILACQIVGFTSSVIQILSISDVYAAYPGGFLGYSEKLLKKADGANPLCLFELDIIDRSCTMSMTTEQTYETLAIKLAGELFTLQLQRKTKLASSKQQSNRRGHEMNPEGNPQEQEWRESERGKNLQGLISIHGVIMVSEPTIVED